MPQDEAALQHSCTARLERSATLAALLYHQGIYSSVRATLSPTSTLSIPRIDVECLRPAAPGQQGRAGRQNPSWSRASRDLLSDVEMIFFRGSFSRPSLKRNGLFSKATNKLSTTEIELTEISSHRLLSLHAELRHLEQV